MRPENCPVLCFACIISFNSHTTLSGYSSYFFSGNFSSASWTWEERNGHFGGGLTLVTTIISDVGVCVCTEICTLFILLRSQTQKFLEKKVWRVPILIFWPHLVVSGLTEPNTAPPAGENGRVCQKTSDVAFPEAVFSEEVLLRRLFRGDYFEAVSIPHYLPFFWVLFSVFVSDWWGVPVQC